MKKEFEMGDSIFCVVDASPIKNGFSYKINGSGDLSMNNQTDKVGFGFAVGLEGDYRNLTYFTEEEMYDHFVHMISPTDSIESILGCLYTIESMGKAKLRDKKINQLLDLDKYN